MPGDEVRDFLKSSETEFAKEMGQTEIGFAGEPAKQVWRMYTDQFRLSEQEAIGLDWNMKEIDKSTKSAAEVYTDLPLARLYNGRAALAELVGPNAPSAEHNRAALALMRVLDGKIDELTAGKAGLARGEYAQAKGIEDAYDLGTKYFMGRNADFSNLDKYHQTFGTPIREYMDKLPPLARESFAEGWKRGLYEKFERDGFAETMNYLIGPPNATGDRVRNEGIDHMRTVLGTETANKLIAMHNDGRRVVDMREKLEALYLFKAASPSKRAELINGAIEMTVEAEQGGALTGLIADLQKIKRAVKPDDQSKVLEMERLLRLRGPELARALNASAKSLIPLPRQVGNTSAALSADIEAYLTGEGIFAPNFEQDTERRGIPQGPSITDRLRGSE
jgi:hypothetical protein